MDEEPLQRHSNEINHLPTIEAVETSTTIKIQTGKHSSQIIKIDTQETMGRKDKTSANSISRVHEENAQREREESLKSYEQGKYSRSSNKRSTVNYSLQLEEKKHLREKIAELQAKLSEYRGTDKEQKDKMIDLNKNILHLGSINEKLKKDNHLKDLEIKRLKDLLDHSSEPQRTSASKYKQQSESLQKMNKSYQKEIIGLKQQNDQHLSHDRDQQQRIRALKAQIQVQKNTIAMQKYQIQTMKKNDQHQKQQRKVMRNQIQKYRSQNTSLMSKINQNNAIINTLKSQQNHQVNKYRQLQRIVQGQKRRIEQMQSQSRKVQGRALQISLRSKQEELKHQMALKDQELKKYKQEYGKVDKELKELIINYKKLSESIAEHRKQKSSSIEKQRTVINRIDGSIKKKVSQLKIDLQNIKAGMNAFKTQIGNNMINGVKEMIEREVEQRVKVMKQREKEERNKDSAQILRIKEQKQQALAQLRQIEEAQKELRAQVQSSKSQILQQQQKISKLSKPTIAKTSSKIEANPQKCLGSCPANKRIEYLKILFTIIFFQAITLSFSIHLIQ